MKRFFLSACAVGATIALSLSLGGCSSTPDYTAYVSEYRAEIYRAETEDFSLVAFFGEREYPYAADGVCAAKSPLMEVYLTAPDNTADYTLSFTIGNATYGGDMSYDSVHARFSYSESVPAVTADGLTFTVVCEGEETVLQAATVKTGKELTMPEIVDKLIEQRPTLFESLTKGNAFDAELCVRLVCNQKCYYFVGVSAAEGWSDYFLLDAESGQICAERTHE